MLKKIAVISTSLYLLGCQTTSLDTADGTGAAIIPIELVAGSQFPCESIGLNFDGDWKRIYFDTESDGERVNGYGLITDLQPQTYQFTEFRCYAGPRMRFNGQKKYIIEEMYMMELTVSANTVTNSRYGVHAFSKFVGGEGSFGISISEVTSDLRDEVERRFLEDPLPNGWSIIQN